MRRLCFLVSTILLVSNCSYLGSATVQPAAPVASGLQSTFVPPPPAIRARLQDYIRCEATTQQSPQYASLHNKFFFTGAVPPTAFYLTAVPTDDEQVALAKWEVDRKTCVVALVDYIGFFAPFDVVQRTLLDSYENNIRTIHDDLIKRKIGYGVALEKIKKAGNTFWAAFAERNKDFRDYLVSYWLEGQATP